MIAGVVGSCGAWDVDVEDEPGAGSDFGACVAVAILDRRGGGME